MSTRRRLNIIVFVCFVLLIESSVVAAAEPEEDDSLLSGDEIGESIDEGLKKDAEKEDETHWGVALTTRNISIPRSMIELFVERAPSGMNEFAFGLEATRRKGNLEMVLGVEWGKLGTEDGLYLDKGDMIPQDEPDYVEFQNFGWFNMDFRFVWRMEVTEFFAVRYGAGLGLGILTGDILRSDYICASASYNSCAQVPGGKVREKEDDVPPVLPVVSAQIGIQARPVKGMVINLDAGLRTSLFVGLGIGYEF